MFHGNQFKCGEIGYTSESLNVLHIQLLHTILIMLENVLKYINYHNQYNMVEEKLKFPYNRL